MTAVFDAAGLSGVTSVGRARQMDGAGLSGVLVEVADAAGVTAYRQLRREVFVDEQGLFRASDRDDVDDDPHCVVLVARLGTQVVGGLRLAPACEPDIGWWHGSRLAVARGARRSDIGARLVRAACAHAEAAGALRFEATVQDPTWFEALGWSQVGRAVVAGRDHAVVRWSIGRVQALVAATKAPLGALLAGLGHGEDGLGGAGWIGDDAAPVPGSDLLAACDAIVPAMVERDPEWAGWCSVLVNVNDLAAMGATPVGLLDAVAAPTAAHAARVLRGFRDAAQGWNLAVLGGHTTLGAPASMAVTALGRTTTPVPAGGGRVGHRVAVTADLGGGWRPGYTGRQWDSTSRLGTAALQALGRSVGDARPAAAKDVSMAGLVGTLGMMAEASGCGAVLDVAAVPRPAEATVGDWLTCFPGFAMVTAGGAARSDHATTAECGELTAGAGVSLRWPDGALTPAVRAGVTGLGAA